MSGSEVRWVRSSVIAPFQILTESFFDPWIGREYVWQTYEKVAERRLRLGSALQALFNDGTIGGGDLPTVGIWTINKPGKEKPASYNLGFTLNIHGHPYVVIYIWTEYDTDNKEIEWQLIDLALSAYNKVGVPLYSTLGKDSTGQFNQITVIGGDLMCQTTTNCYCLSRKQSTCQYQPSNNSAPIKPSKIRMECILTKLKITE
jgi:hypothetical protein